VVRAQPLRAQPLRANTEGRPNVPAYAIQLVMRGPGVHGVYSPLRFEDNAVPSISVPLAGAIMPDLTKI
jgi:hypothetical protein